MSVELTVVICTHNPREDYLGRTLEALRKQTLPYEQWDFLVVDNASDPPLSERLDLSWHPQSRIVEEPELGILPCRIRGLTETKTPLVLFVDDDNVLAENYLEESMRIGAEYPLMGTWGGSMIAEYECPPPEWIGEFSNLLACRKVDKIRWTNFIMIPTAGMCLRREIADEFVQRVQGDPRRKHLGRRGKDGLTNAEDEDLALTASDLKFSIGSFPSLSMKHLISAGRLELDYLIRLREGTDFSVMILHALRGDPPQAVETSPLRTWIGGMRRKLFWKQRERLLFEANMRARKRACEVIAEWGENE